VDQVDAGRREEQSGEAKAVIDEINAALAGQDAWMQRLPGLIEKYGLSWADAGEKAKQAHLDEIAAGLIQDFADLSKAGFDVTTITEHMTDAVNDYVHQAMLTGTEIPAAMKPLLQKMIDMGALTDVAGNKLADLSGLTFAETLTEGFKSVVDAINQLTKALTGDLGGALDALGRRKVVIPVSFEPTNKPGDPAEPVGDGRACRVRQDFAFRPRWPGELRADRHGHGARHVDARRDRAECRPAAERRRPGPRRAGGRPRRDEAAARRHVAHDARPASANRRRGG
jgi:hypothetical protein